MYSIGWKLKTFCKEQEDRSGNARINGRRMNIWYEVLAESSDKKRGCAVVKCGALLQSQ
jgi:hypothetical protein